MILKDNCRGLATLSIISVSSTTSFSATDDNISHKIVPKKGLFQCDQIRSGTENREETFLRDGGVMKKNERYPNMSISKLFFFSIPPLKTFENLTLKPFVHFTKGH